MEWTIGISLEKTSEKTKKTKSRSKKRSKKRARMAVFRVCTFGRYGEMSGGPFFLIRIVVVVVIVE